MRLVNTQTLQLKEFFDNSAEDLEYAILSHTWEKEEVIFPDMQDLDKAQAKAGFGKFRDACALAARQGHSYIWIDTCCIDKSSSAELSEAINSMFNWYGDSRVCYAYLCDVENAAEMGNSRWFTRGWTLQELIAPSRVEFYSTSWDYIGEKQDDDIISVVSRASRVDEWVLAGVIGLDEVSVAKKLYWASERKTTRVEDKAYCLMGLFYVNMPLLYGEREQSFMRLQHEITKRTDDQSILAWYSFPTTRPTSKMVKVGTNWLGYYQRLASCFAPSPECFALSGNISFSPPRAQNDLLHHMELAPGPHTEFSAIIITNEMPGAVKEVILPCQIGPIPGTFPTIHLTTEGIGRGRYNRILLAGTVSQFSMHNPEFLLTHKGENKHSFGLDLLFMAIEQTHKGPDKAVYNIGRSDGTANKFAIQRIMVGSTFVHFPPLSRPTSTGSGAGTDAAGKELDREDKPMLSENIFWILPLENNSSSTSALILDVFPRRNWDCSTRQFIWTAVTYNPANPGDSISVAGVASIDLRLTRDAKSENKSLGKAVLVFGTFAVKFAYPVRSEVPPHLLQRENPTLEPWCALIKHNEASDLKNYLDPKIATANPQQQASLKFGTGQKLHANARTEHITSKRYSLIKLWTSDTEEPVEVVSDEHAASMEQDG